MSSVFPFLFNEVQYVSIFPSFSMDLSIHFWNVIIETVGKETCIKRMYFILQKISIGPNEDFCNGVKGG